MTGKESWLSPFEDRALRGHLRVTERNKHARGNA
jgi:hypothetical protein